MPKQNYSKEPRKIVRNAERVIETGRGPDYSRGWAYVNLRIPLDILEEIDRHLLKRRTKSPRMHWIIEAIQEKMEQERKQNP